MDRIQGNKIQPIISGSSNTGRHSNLRPWGKNSFKNPEKIDKRKVIGYIRFNP